MNESPPTTYELVVGPGNGDWATVKPLVKSWLIDAGYEAFVEGVVDDIDIPFDYSFASSDPFADAGGETSALSIYRFDRSELERLAAGLRAEFQGDQSISATLRAHDTAAWQEGWKESFRPFSTRRFTVRPPWEPVSTGDDRYQIVIEPGMAFGTGQHATTHLCLEVIESLPLDGRRVADVGTGTGILSIAAKALAAAEVVATDIDPEAREAAARNGADNNALFSVVPGGVPPGCFDLVIANILSVVLLRLRDDLCAACAPGGHLLLSGILGEEASAVQEAFCCGPLSPVRSAERDGWTALLLRRDGDHRSHAQTAGAGLPA